MKYIDRIYGEVEITEPVILELIESPTLQRLRGIDQHGYFVVYASASKQSRFEHSVGVYLLLRRYGASLDEQVAGLIHDVSHAAFSHCIDYVLDEGSQKTQSHQDNVFEEYVRNSEIPSILKKFGMDLEYILDDKHFPLKETQLPDLCADRIDYSLRGISAFKLAPKEKIPYILNHLKAENFQWVFDNLEAAYAHAKLFLTLNTQYYSDLVTAVVFKTVGDYLKYALEKEYISKKDLYTTDQEVLSKIGKYLDKDKKLRHLFSRMNNEVRYENNPGDYETSLFCKSRIIDPLCKVDGKTKRLSEVMPDWKKVLEEEMKPKEYFIKFLE